MFDEAVWSFALIAIAVECRYANERAAWSFDEAVWSFVLIEYSGPFDGAICTFGRFVFIMCLEELFESGLWCGDGDTWRFNRTLSNR